MANEPKKNDGHELSEVAGLRAQLAEAKAEAGYHKAIVVKLMETDPRVHELLRTPKPLADEHKGTRKYIVGAAGYVDPALGLLKKGEIAVLVNQRPVRDMVPLDESKSLAEQITEVPVKPVATVRAADKSPT